MAAAAAAALVAFLALAACAPLTALNAFARNDSCRLEEGIAYGPTAAPPARRLHADRAREPAGGPVVVFF